MALVARLVPPGPGRRAVGPLRVMSRASLAACLLAAGCEAVLTGAPEAADVMDGPLRGLTGAELASFVEGDAQFESAFVAGAGLGPIFNNVSCESCHPGDGRGRPEPAFSTVVVRVDPGSAPGRHGSATIEQRALAGVEAERVPEGVAVSRRLPPPVFGLGLIESIPAERIAAGADPEDRDGDGVSGRVHWVEPAPWVPASEPGAGPGPQVGRFTRRARASTILEQVADAYHKDIGITSEFLPRENENLSATTPPIDAAPDPELPAAVIHSVVAYLRLLSPPEPGPLTESRRAGERLFREIGCAACHTPELRTGGHRIATLSDRPVRLYSDLLLHDMGDELADGVADGDATGREWRTAPLWGLRVMREFLAGSAFLMHDGRARSVAEAIGLHGGEASSSRARYRGLTVADRARLLDFVESR
jgi:CxxC motif-containing protein (DUF1111 family)